MITTCNQPIFIKVPCYLTGRLVLDTDRERIRQKMAKFLVEERGYRIGELMPDREIAIEASGQKVIALVDLTVNINGRSLMILRGGPGSVVTRESGTIAAARLLESDHIVPWAVQANLFDAALLNVRTKKAVSYGWDKIPSRQKLIEMTSDWPPARLPEKRIPIERQILYSYDTHG
ncbi:MAG: type I restriction enzyme HsdR N-terminal domain-containing protein [Desulfobacteraceae bacterium]|nr:type I restriction enzyme HsdR N-terminal domain-containing protein [Desulfobacteraceae bacterium]